MIPPDEAEHVDVDEVLPPESADPRTSKNPSASASSGPKAAAKRAFPGLIANLLDECLTVPNTKIRLGLDPIIGFFFPAVGDAVTAALGSTILLEALRRQVPRRVLIRMGTNVALNAGLGAIPLFGDVFSVWFKSNARNYTLLQRHAQSQETPPEVQPSLWPLFAFVLAIFTLIALVMFILVILFRWAFIHP